MVRILNILKHCFFIFIVSLQTACLGDKEQKEFTPWGTVVGEENTDSIETESLSVGELQSQGEMIMLTISGPDTYYDYHGQGMGLHFLLCEKLAQRIGVKLRVELCKDTLEMKKKLQNNEGDIIACPVNDKDLFLCGPKWAVNKENVSLQNEIKVWYKPAMLEEIKKYQQNLLANGGVTRKVYAPIINREKGLISKWDHLFKKYSSIPRLDWKLLAAQCYQESCFDPNACSWAGACGLMQIMPSTGTLLGLEKKDLFNPEKNVSAAARYMAQLMKEFDDVDSQYDRICFALASYNGGKYHVRDAMALAKKNNQNPYRWAHVSAYILKLTQPQYYNDSVVKYGYMRGTETHDYVERIINRWREYGGKTPRSVQGYYGYDGPSTQPAINTSGAIPRPAKKKHRFSEQ